LGAKNNTRARRETADREGRGEAAQIPRQHRHFVFARMAGRRPGAGEGQKNWPKTGQKIVQKSLTRAFVGDANFDAFRLCAVII